MINGYANAVAAFNTRKTKYDAIYLTIDKPYSKVSGWGGGIAYTGVLTSKENGNPGGERLQLRLSRYSPQLHLFQIPVTRNITLWSMG